MGEGWCISGLVVSWLGGGDICGFLGEIWWNGSGLGGLGNIGGDGNCWNDGIFLFFIIGDCLGIDWIICCWILVGKRGWFV